MPSPGPEVVTLGVTGIVLVVLSTVLWVVSLVLSILAIVYGNRMKDDAKFILGIVGLFIPIVGIVGFFIHFQEQKIFIKKYRLNYQNKIDGMQKELDDIEKKNK